MKDPSVIADMLKGRLAARAGQPSSAPMDDMPPSDGADGSADPVGDAMQAFMAAVDSKDPSAAADAFRAAFKACELEPHMEPGEQE